MTVTVTVTVTVNPPPPSSTMHLGALTDSSSPVGSRGWRATVWVTIHDSNHALVANATVTGAWTGAGGRTTCTTDSVGRCRLRSNRIRNSVGSVDFTVTNVTGSLAYTTPGDVSIPITILKP